MSDNEKVRKLQKELRDLDMRRTKAEVLLELSAVLKRLGRDSEAEAVKERWQDERRY